MQKAPMVLRSWTNSARKGCVLPSLAISSTYSRWQDQSAAALRRAPP